MCLPRMETQCVIYITQKLNKISKIPSEKIFVANMGIKYNLKFKPGSIHLISVIKIVGNFQNFYT